MKEIPKVNYLDQEHVEIKSYYLLDFTAETLPPAKVYFHKRVGYVRNPLVEIKVLHGDIFCSYCKARGHNGEECPLKPLDAKQICKHCSSNVNRHNYFCCPQIDLETKMVKINELPKVAFKRAFQDKDPYRRIPAEVFEHEKFPVEYLNKQQLQRLVILPLKEKERLAQQ